MEYFPNPEDRHLTPHYHPMPDFKQLSFKQEYIVAGRTVLENMAHHTHPSAWKGKGALISPRLMQSKVGMTLLHFSCRAHPPGSANHGKQMGAGARTEGVEKEREREQPGHG